MIIGGIQKDGIVSLIRNEKTYTFNLISKKDDSPKIIFDRNYQDKYNDPGNLVMIKNEYGRKIVHQKEGVVSLISDGFTKDGQFSTLYTMNRIIR